LTSTIRWGWIFISLITDPVKVVDISERGINILEIKNNKVLLHKQIEKKNGMVFMRLKSRSILNL